MDSGFIYLLLAGLANGLCLMVGVVCNLNFYLTPVFFIIHFLQDTNVSFFFFPLTISSVSEAAPIIRIKGTHFSVQSQQPLKVFPSEIDMCRVVWYWGKQDCVCCK